MTSATSRDLRRALELARELARRNPWRPLPGPQLRAFECTADVVGYGGAAGGGKSDVIIGKALLKHQKTMVVRRNGTEHVGMLDRVAEIVGHRDGFDGRLGIWRGLGPREVQIELGSLPNLGDEQKYRGRPHDLLAFDEVTEIPESQVRFLMTWNRTTTPGQHCQTLMTFNPPSTAEGRWVITFFAPWLDPKHPNPAVPGELRYYATLDGRDVEVGGPAPFEHNGETVIPRSRTFIAARVTDNRFLMGTNYVSQLQALPEPLRSQMLYGDFRAGMKDSPWQVIPTAWVDAAVERWKPLTPKPVMDSIGVDVARGGDDYTVIARRHGWWFDVPIAEPGAETPNGPSVAGLVIAAMRDGAPVHIDVIGVGAAPYDFLLEARQHVIGVNVSEKPLGTDKSGRLRFANQRSELWWRMREALDPEANNGIALPNDPKLIADLCAPMFKVQGGAIYIESREEIVKRIGRSPDYASAYVLALRETPKLAAIRHLVTPKDDAVRGHDPFAIFSR